MIHAAWLWFLHITGADDESGPWYGFWSGFAGDIPLFGVFLVAWNHLNCKQEGCWRVGRPHAGHLCRRCASQRVDAEPDHVHRDADHEPERDADHPKDEGQGEHRPHERDEDRPTGETPRAE